MLAWAQSGAGRLLLLLTFTALFYPLYTPYLLPGRPGPWQIILSAALCSLAGSYRAYMLALTTLAGPLLAPDWYPSGWLKNLAEQQGLPPHSLFPLQLLAVAYLALMTTAFYRLRRKYPQSWPLPALFLLYAVNLALVLSPLSAGPAGLLLYTGLWAFSAYFWFIAFALRDASSPQASPAWFQLATFHPYFGGSIIPLGLGAAHLRQRQAKDNQSLARCQLKGIKLLLACWVASGLLAALIRLRQWARLPEFSLILHQYLDGQVFYPRSLCWLSLLEAFPESLMQGFLLGNLLIGAARIGGFQLLQQVYQPWGARSIADYWNRVSYYYKETVLQLFFYPCYLRYFKGWPRLRQAFAIFMAAGVGNLLFHIRLLVPQLLQRGPLETLRGMHTYFCYCLILCAGLYFSQLKSSQQRAALTLRQRILTLGSIFLFYSLLGVFDELYSPWGPWARCKFLAYLWGWRGAP
ncbi:MAG: hypothetical protein KF760_19355 [Candidatus Eremiobacteraeota bacterium]|nr:hypothetical protein [Candidatus Eremiobacteraeota bacterium]MCW5868327.1 hypothetical protein [Candidatus Eremiobacteraeota bacterium]